MQIKEKWNKIQSVIFHIYLSAKSEYYNSFLQKMQQVFKNVLCLAYSSTQCLFFESIVFFVT